MLPHVLAVFATLFVWWFSTGAILYANGLPRWTHAWTAVFATLVAVASLGGLWATRDLATVGGAYLGFLCAIGVWGWHEVMFLTGRITGPRTDAAPPAGSGVSRVRAAIEAILYHEAALILTLVAIWALTSGGANLTGVATFAVLWVMRLSAKLNVFLGVRNLSEEFLPDHLAYLQSYFRRAPMNPLLPVSVAGGIAACAVVVHGTWAADADPHAVVGGTLVATLLMLAVVEHIFMIAPFSPVTLWRWGLASRRPGRIGAVS